MPQALCSVPRPAHALPYSPTLHSVIPPSTPFPLSPLTPLHTLPHSPTRCRTHYGAWAPTCPTAGSGRFTWAFSQWGGSQVAQLQPWGDVVQEAEQCQQQHQQQVWDEPAGALSDLGGDLGGAAPLQTSRAFPGPQCGVLRPTAVGPPLTTMCASSSGLHAGRAVGNMVI